jgi:ectoine hydroxylase-related dioxygenase (phytanoyl-CoA dioxygenase family)
MGKHQGSTFILSNKLTNEQLEYFRENGFIQFKNFISRETVVDFISELNSIEKKLLDEGIEKINGIPLKFGKDADGHKMIQRFCFLSQFSDLFHFLLKDPRLHALTEFLSPHEGRIAELEKDGLILNHYIQLPESKFTQMGWHTDSPRDIFMGHRIMPMLNIGIHLDDCSYENGGLRVLPGTHKQGIFQMFFRKRYFTDNNPDPGEVGFDVDAGDLTVHDGRIWHRAQRSNCIGEKSRRRVMYIPVVTGKYRPKHSKSKTPLYHYFASKIQN